MGIKVRERNNNNYKNYVWKEIEKKEEEPNAIISKSQTDNSVNNDVIRYK